MVFVCILENALENTFLSGFSHFPKIQTNIIIENLNIYTQKETKIKTKESKSHEREREREREIGSWVTWWWWQ